MIFGALIFLILFSVTGYLLFSTKPKSFNDPAQDDEEFEISEF